MLHKCRRDQWHIDDLDWELTPPALPRDKEIAVVQYFTDMAGIERLAGALFAEQRRFVTDPLLKEIFTTFIGDEERHAQVAQRLADFYNVHEYRRYEQNRHLVAFRPVFLDTIRLVAPEIANAYITSGELLLDIALLRSLDDYVDDEMSHQAMRLINRDESRHIAIDYYMVGLYCSDEYQSQQAALPDPSALERLRSAKTFTMMLYYAEPFLRDVFFEPMDLTDPEGKRMMQAFKRMQLLSRRPEVAKRPFTRFLRTIQLLFNAPVIGKLFGGTLARVSGLDRRVLVELISDDEAKEAARMSLSDLAAEALAVKTLS